MAIYSAVPPPPESPTTTASTHQPSSYQPGHKTNPSVASTASLDIEAWTVSALQSLTISPVTRGTGGTPLAIPLDAHHGATHERAEGVSGVQRVTMDLSAGVGAGITPPRRPPSRRDSQRKREMLLKGKEGSRQRRRWENARLMDVPNVQPPLPSDWEVHPTHPVHHVQYHLAQFWDMGMAQRAEARRRQNANKVQPAASARASTAPGRVPRELRDTAKRSPAVRGWVKVLEEPVRKFLAGGEETQREEKEVSDSEDDEIVFVGRGGASTLEGQEWKRARREVRDKPVETGMVLDSVGEDEQSGAFKRWLTHSISDYYGLESRSLSVGDPVRRVVYVGVRKLATQTPPMVRMELPRPLWELC